MSHCAGTLFNSPSERGRESEALKRRGRCYPLTPLWIQACAGMTKDGENDGQSIPLAPLRSAKGGDSSLHSE